MLRVDRAFVTAFSKEEKKRQFIVDEEQEDEVLANRSPQELSTNMFDKMF